MIFAIIIFILDRCHRFFFRINNLKLFNTSFFKLTAHYFCKRTHFCFVNICHFKCTCIHLISGSHAAYYRYIHLLTLHDKRYFRCHGIYCIYNIIILFKWKCICIFRQEKSLIDIYRYLWIYLQNTLTHNIYFVFSDRFSRCDKLAVKICKADFIVIYQIYLLHSAADKCINSITADSAYTKDCHS